MYVNKFDFKIGNSYEYNELPEETQEDIRVQFENNHDENYDDYLWRFKLLYPEDIEDHIINHFGEYNIGEALDDPYMIELIRDIKNRGLDYPSVGSEGNHRALIHWYLKMPLPYLEPVLKDLDD